METEGERSFSNLSDHSDVLLFDDFCAFVL